MINQDKLRTLVMAKSKTSGLAPIYFTETTCLNDF